MKGGACKNSNRRIGRPVQSTPTYSNWLRVLDIVCSEPGYHWRLVYSLPFGNMFKWWGEHLFKQFKLGEVPEESKRLLATGFTFREHLG